MTQSARLPVPTVNSAPRAGRASSATASGHLNFIIMEDRMTFRAERTITNGRLEVQVDHDDKTEERRISVYRGETLLALEFVRPLDAIINNLIQVATSRSHQFPEPR